MRAIVMSAATALVLALPGMVLADQALAQKNACLSCHGVDRKMVGPAFKEVAARYKNDQNAEAMLVKKIKEGGKGVWGPIPMPPNPHVKDEDAKKIVAWILSL